MRKTSFVLTLFVSSVLLLQAQAWASGSGGATATTQAPAPKLYRVQQTTSQSRSLTFAGLNTATVQATSDCISKDATLTFEWGETTKKVRTSSKGSFTVKLSKIPRTNRSVDIDDVTRFTCDGGVLAFTGTSTVHLLALVVILVMGGVLLVIISGRQRRPARGQS
jgi:hypothetical protein